MKDLVLFRKLLEIPKSCIGLIPKWRYHDGILWLSCSSLYFEPLFEVGSFKKVHHLVPCENNYYIMIKKKLLPNNSQMHARKWLPLQSCSKHTDILSFGVSCVRSSFWKKPLWELSYDKALLLTSDHTIWKCSFAALTLATQSLYHLRWDIR